MFDVNHVKLFFAKNGIFVALVLLFVLFSVLNSQFLSVRNVQNIFLQSAEVGLLVFPIAFLLMAGQIDLSVGSIASLAAVTSGLVLSSTQNLLLGLLVGFAVGIVAGALNGFLIAVLGFNSFVITLGGLSLWGGAAMYLTNGKTIGRSELPESFYDMGKFTIAGVPIQLILLVIIVVASWYLLNRTQAGKQILAVGGNSRAAFLMGIKVKRTQFLLYVAVGLFASFAGIMLSAKVQSASPQIGSGLELQALTIVLLGGVAFYGGAGRISGVVAGLLFIKVLATGLVFMQASPFIQTMLTGAVLIVAVALDTSIQKTIRKTLTDMRKKELRKKAAAEPQAVATE